MPLETEQTDDQEAVVGSRNDERLKMFEQIADSADDVRKEELDDVPEDQPRQEASEEAPETEEAPPPKVAPAPPPQKRKLKVNGREIELTDEEILERAQKVEAADDYLREAAKLYKEAKTQSPPQPVAAPAEQEEKVGEDDLALARALQVGNEEEAAKAIRLIEQRAIQRLQQTTVPTETLVFQAVELKKLQEKFEQENSDVLSDPVLKTVVAAADARLQQQDKESGVTRSPYDRWTQAAKAVRDWKTQLQGAQSFEAKKQAKAESVKSVPTASKRAAPPPEDADEEDDPRSVIAKMAKDRAGRYLNS